MRTVILQEWITLDGMAAGPGGSVDFVPASTEGDRSFGEAQMAFLDEIDTIVLGRVTYSLFAGFWPHVTQGEEKPFADKLNGTPKVIFSRTLDRAPWGSWDEGRIVRRDPADELSALKRQSGKNIVIWGSLSLAQSLMQSGAIDEYRLVVCPVVLGSGRPLFHDSARPPHLTLVSVRAFDRGAVSLQYTARA